jgi:hypothetical protein
MTERVREAFRLELRTHHDRPQGRPTCATKLMARQRLLLLCSRSRSRDPACRHTIRHAAHFVPNRMVAHPRLEDSAVFGPNKPIDGQPKLTLGKVFCLIGASPHQFFRP